jgi:acetyltransferase-like isoleucine patch superfamily enzyme
MRDLQRHLEALRRDRDRAMRERWGRSLPLSEELFDRWDRARELGFGANTSIYHQSYVYGDVSVGENTWIGPMTVLDGSGGLRIGSWCSISAGAQLYSHSTVEWAVTAGQAENRHGPTEVGDRTFLGPLSVVSMGVTIGTGCVVGAHAFVNGDIPDGAIAVGVPARVVGRVVLEGDSVHLSYF